MNPAGEKIPSGDPSYFLAKYSYKQGNRKEVGAKPVREVQSEEGCRSFATQAGGTAPSPPSTPSFVCPGLAAAASPIREGGATVLPAHRLRLPDASAHYPARLSGVPLWLPLSRCPLSPVRLVRRGRSSVGLGGSRPCACPPPGFWLGAGVACPGRFLVLLPVSASRSCLSWAFVRGVRPGRALGLLGCGRGRFAVRVLRPLVLFRSCGST